MRSWVKPLAIVAALLLLVGGFFVVQKVRRQIVVGPVRIDPRAEIDPEKTYELTVWEHEVPLPWDAGAHHKVLAEAVAEFEKAWPNVKVQLVMLPWHEDHEQMREALATGAPPDVYGMSLGVRKLSPEWQIPVGAFMNPQTKGDTLPAAMQSISDPDGLWAWPRWVLPRQWVVREDLSPDLQVGRRGWTSAQFLEVIGKAIAANGGTGVALNPYDGNLLYEVMVASTGKNLIQEDGSRGWSVEELTAGLSFFKSLIDGDMTGDDVERMSRSRLDAFWNRRAAAVSPVNPWLMRHMLTRGGVASLPPGNPGDAANVRHLVLPAPPPTVNPATLGRFQPATVSGYAVFRREPYLGDDHTKAAMLLAEHLSRRLGPWEAAQLFAVPAHPSTWERWRSESGLPAKESDLLIEWAKIAVAAPLADTPAMMQQRAIETLLPQELVKLWRGASPESIARSIADEVDSLKAMAKSTASTLPLRQ